MEMSDEVKEIYDQAKELGYDIFNIYDPFYNDICTPYKTLIILIFYSLIGLIIFIIMMIPNAKKIVNFRGIY